MWISLFCVDIKPFCLWTNLWISRGVIHIINKSENCQIKKLDLESSYPQVIHRLSTGFDRVIHIFFAVCGFNLSLIFL